MEKIETQLVVNQICVNSEGQSVLVKQIYLPNLEGVSLVEFKHIRTAQTEFLPIERFRRLFS